MILDKNNLIICTYIHIYHVFTYVINGKLKNVKGSLNVMD